MKHIYLLILVLTVFFTGCDKKETDVPTPNKVEKNVSVDEQLIGNWKEVETTVSEYDKNNTLLYTTPNISPTKVAFDGEKVITIYAESFLPKDTTTYSVSQVGDKSFLLYADDSRKYEVKEISKTNLTLVVKQMGSEFSGAPFEYQLYTRKLIKL